MPVTDRPPPAPDVAEQLRLADRRLVELRIERSSYWETWRDISHFILPDRGRYLAMPNQGNRGIPKNRRIVDKTATIAMSKLSAFLMAGITSPARAWFQLGTSNTAITDSDDVRQWCAEVTRRMMVVLSSGNFYNSIEQCYSEISGFGTAAMICMPDYEDVVRFYPLTAGEYYLGINGRLETDTLIREYVQNVGQLGDKFGVENCSPTVQALYNDQRYDREVPVIHAIMPNRNPKRGALGWQAMPWISVYYEYGQTAQGPLRIEGFHVRPFIGPRWMVLSNDTYGHGLGEDTLPDVKSLQSIQLRYAEALDKIVRPPMAADQKLKQGLTSLLPGALNYIPGLSAISGNQAPVRPVYEVPTRLDVMADRVAKFQDQIGRTLKTDLIQAITNMEGVQPRNEMEINARQQEQMLQLGPVLERFHNEGLSPLIRCVYHYMDRQGLLPPKPKALSGQAVEPTYISILAQAQKAVGLTAIESVYRFAGGIIAVDPTAMDTFDTDEALREYATMSGMPAPIIRSKEQVQAIQASRAKQQQDAQAAQQAMAVAQGAQVLGKTQVGGGQNALQAMAGG